MELLRSTIKYERQLFGCHMVIRFGAMSFVAIAALLVGMRYLPPHP
jgi:hypothetical protein